MNKNVKMKSYSELIRLKTFEERFEYLKLKGNVGRRTFGSERYLNQVLYQSPEWRDFRRKIIIRDNGCDLGMEGYSIYGIKITICDNGFDLGTEGYSTAGTKIIVHHINPITIEDIKNRSPKIFDPDNVICVSHMTHEAIHYGDKNLLPSVATERRPGDTCPWKTNER